MALKRKTPLRPKKKITARALDPDVINRLLGEGKLQKGSTFKAKPKPMRKRAQRKGLTQMDVFRQIWAERPHYCEICCKPIPEPRAGNFFHILGKGAYPKYKLLKENILISCCFDGVSEGCHELFHARGRSLASMPNWIPVFEKLLS